MADLRPCVLKKDQQEHFNLKRGWMVNAWRLVDPVTGRDLVQPWFGTKGEARNYAKATNLKIIFEDDPQQRSTNAPGRGTTNQPQGAPMNFSELTPKQQARTTDEEMTNYVAIACAEQGIMIPTKPTPMPMPLMPTLKTKTYYCVESNYAVIGLFDSMEKAAAFIKLKPYARDYDYGIDSSINYAQVHENLRISMLDLPDHEDIKKHADVLRDIKRIRDLNEKADRDYGKKKNQVVSIEQELISQRDSRRDEEASYREIYTYWQTCLELSNGIPGIALNFLLRRYEINAVRNAMHYLDDEWLAQDPMTLDQESATASDEK